ncbi:hypothetical protein Nmel_005086 [Mimus melanotis]
MFLQKELPAIVFITDVQEKACDLFFLNTSATTFFINDREQRLTAAHEEIFWSTGVLEKSFKKNSFAPTPNARGQEEAARPLPPSYTRADPARRQPG